MNNSWQAAKIQVVENQERRSLKKAGDNTVITRKIFPRELDIYLSRGWAILSHTQSTYTSNQSYMVVIETEVLRERFSNASKV